MDIKEIEELTALMERQGLKRMVVKRKDFELELERESRGMLVVASHEDMPPAIPASAEKRELEKKSEGRFISSPIVGTFYSSPSPKDPVFVKVGERVEEGKVVCIIEAMKVMNEVKAAFSGTVQEILVKNGEPVEFGTRLIRIV